MQLVLRIILALTIAVAGFAIYKGMEEKKAKEIIVADFNSTKSTLATTEKNLADTKKTLKDTESTLASTKGQLTTANGEIATQKTKIGEQEARITDVEGRLQTASTQLASKTAEIEGILKSLPEGMAPDQVGTKIKEYRDQLATYDQEKKLLNEQLAKLNADYKAAKDLIERRKTGKLPEGLVGHVLALNEDWNFIVIDIGATQGIIENAHLIVYRNGTLIGKVKVTSVEPSISIADVDPGWKQGQIQEGDSVVGDSSTM